MSSMSDSVAAQLFEWRDFEQFVAGLYDGATDVDVRHDVTLRGKSGAKRQVDVHITIKHMFHDIVVLVECKCLKDRVDRPKVDVLAAAIRDLGAAKGAIFTTVGYEEGADLYARDQGIDIFVVRDLRDHEWGLPGRHIEFDVHFIHCHAAAMSFSDSKAIVYRPPVPTPLELKITVNPNEPPPENLTLHSARDGSQGPNFVTLLERACASVGRQISRQLPRLPPDADSRVDLLEGSMEIDASDCDHRVLPRDGYDVHLGKITVNYKLRIRKWRHKFDRATNVDFAHIVENYVNGKRFLISKKTGQSVNRVPVADRTDEETASALVNGTAFEVIFTPWAPIDESKPPDARYSVNLVRIRLVDLVSASAQQTPSIVLPPG